MGLLGIFYENILFGLQQEKMSSSWLVHVCIWCLNPCQSSGDTMKMGKRKDWNDQVLDTFTDRLN